MNLRAHAARARGEEFTVSCSNQPFQFFPVSISFTRHFMRAGDESRCVLKVAAACFKTNEHISELKLYVDAAIHDAQKPSAGLSPCREN